MIKFLILSIILILNINAQASQDYSVTNQGNLTLININEDLNLKGIEFISDGLFYKNLLYTKPREYEGKVVCLFVINRANSTMLEANSVRILGYS
jgi:hypothetical protein